MKMKKAASEMSHLTMLKEWEWRSLTQGDAKFVSSIGSPTEDMILSSRRNSFILYILLGSVPMETQPSRKLERIIWKGGYFHRLAEKMRCINFQTKIWTQFTKIVWDSGFQHYIPDSEIEEMIEDPVEILDKG